MIDAEDFQIPGTNTLKNKLGITSSDALSAAVSQFTERRLAELQASPIRGGFDSSHLQEIHRYLYQDVFDWAGELRRIEKGGAPPSDLEDTLNRVFDRLSHENLLKGLDKDTWMRRATGHIEELRSLHPFLAGNDLVIQEFAMELARKNNLRLEWQETPDAVNDIVAFTELAERSAQLRRLIMLAVDADPAIPSPRHHHTLEHGNELSLSFPSTRS
jgi:cell filamentation protein